MKKTVQKGFTLVELVVVIVILGILAATALPRFINLGADARAAAVEGVAGGMRSAVGVVQARHFANGGTAATVTMADSTVVDVAAATGIPAGTATGIGAALNTSEPLTYAAGVATYAGAAANCKADYTGATGVVTVVTSGC